MCHHKMVSSNKAIVCYMSCIIKYILLKFVLIINFITLFNINKVFDSLLKEKNSTKCLWEVSKICFGVFDERGIFLNVRGLYDKNLALVLCSIITFQFEKLNPTFSIICTPLKKYNCSNPSKYAFVLLLDIRFFPLVWNHKIWSL